MDLAGNHRISFHRNLKEAMKYRVINTGMPVLWFPKWLVVDPDQTSKLYQIRFRGAK
jgi:hypothetical protein